MVQSESLSCFLAAVEQTDLHFVAEELKQALRSAALFCFSIITSSDQSPGLKTELLHYQEQLLRALVALDTDLDADVKYVPGLVHVLTAQGKVAEAAAWERVISTNASSRRH